jgi:hypothetical protein
MFGHWWIPFSFGRFFVRSVRMSNPSDQNFQDYKRAEKKALELLAAMKAVTPKKADIELALLVAIFELHKGTMPASAVNGIIQGHLKEILPFYTAKPAAP